MAETWRQRADRLVELESQINPDFDPEDPAFMQMLKQSIDIGNRMDKEVIFQFVRDNHGRPKTPVNPEKPTDPVDFPVSPGPPERPSKGPGRREEG